MDSLAAEKRQSESSAGVLGRQGDAARARLGQFLSLLVRLLGVDARPVRGEAGGGDAVAVQAKKAKKAGGKRAAAGGGEGVADVCPECGRALAECGQRLEVSAAADCRCCAVALTVAVQGGCRMCEVLWLAQEAERSRRGQRGVVDRSRRVALVVALVAALVALFASLCLRRS